MYPSRRVSLLANDLYVYRFPRNELYLTGGRGTSLEPRTGTLSASISGCSLSLATGEKPVAKWRSVYSAVSSLACRRSWLMGRDWPPRTGKVVETLIHGWIVAGGDSSTMNSATCSSTRPSILLEARNSTPCPVSCCSDCCLRYLVIRGSWARYSLRFWLPLSLSTVAKAGRWVEIAGASPLNLKGDSKTLAKWIWPLGTRLEPLACWGKRTWIYFVPCSSLLPARETKVEKRFVLFDLQRKLIYLKYLTFFSRKEIIFGSSIELFTFYTLDFVEIRISIDKNSEERLPNNFLD